MRSTLLPWALTLCSGLLAGCVSYGRASEAEPCTSTEDCERTLECVRVDNDASVCLPRPPGREERSCDVDNDCTLSDGQLWPLEAECLDGACRCLGADILCFDDNDEDIDTFTVILEEETCRCVTRGGEGDACVTSHTCDVDLACTGGECRSAPGESGAACCDDGRSCTRQASCEGGFCTEFRDNNDVGVCR
jgi:hypothetical protein